MVVEAHQYIQYSRQELVRLMNARIMSGIVIEVSTTEDKAKVNVYGSKANGAPFGEMWIDLFYH